jgi:hypothetical protein
MGPQDKPPTIAPFPTTPVLTEGNSYYGYFQFLSMSPTNYVALNNKSMSTYVRRNTFFPIVVSVENRRIDFELRLRTLRTTKTNNITPV